MSVPAVLFYRANEEYGAFSNFARFAVVVVHAGGRLEGPTSEHVFQAFKFVETDPEHAAAILAAPRPGPAARLGRDRSRPIRSDWERVKDDVMRLVVGSKFRQHPELHSLLLSTGARPIVEHTTNDAYWADAGDGTGRNQLGVTLMEVRSALAGGPGALDGYIARASACLGR